MSEITTIGLDLAKHVFQVHGVLRARLPYLLRSEATRFKKRKTEAEIRWIGNRGAMAKPGVCGRVALVTKRRRSKERKNVDIVTVVSH
jgi:hypothetical protein